MAAVYRVIPDRPMGFAPHSGNGTFAGAVIKDKWWAFAFPIFQCLFQTLSIISFYLKGMSALPGFYDGQLENYILFAAMTAIGFLYEKSFC